MEEKINEEILKLEAQYKKLNTELNDIANSYNSKIDELNNQVRALQAEGQAKVDELRIQREGTFQAMQSLKSMLNNGKSEINFNNTEKQEDKSKPVLTEEEINNINSITETIKTSSKKGRTKKNDSVKSAETDNIPDYLQGEYKKLK